MDIDFSFLSKREVNLNWELPLRLVAFIPQEVCMEHGIRFQQFHDMAK